MFDFGTNRRFLMLAPLDLCLRTGRVIFTLTRTTIDFVTYFLSGRIFLSGFGTLFCSKISAVTVDLFFLTGEKIGSNTCTGKRSSIRDTRGIIDAILDGSIDKAPTKVIPYFDFVVPTELPGVDPNILDPRDTYADAAQWDEKAKDLAGRFIKNFAKFTGNEAGKKLVAAGPKL